MSIWRKNIPKALAEGNAASQSFSCAISIVWLELSSSEPGFFRLPRTRRGLPGEIKGRLQSPHGGLHPGELACGAGTQLEIQKERGMRTRTGTWTARQKEDREESTCLPGQDVDHLHLRCQHALAIDRREERADLHADLAGGAGPVGNTHPAAHCVGLWNPVFGCNVYVLESSQEDEKIWIEAPNRRR